MNSTHNKTNSETVQNALTDSLNSEKSTSIQSYNKHIVVKNKAQTTKHTVSNKETVILPYTHEQLEPVDTWDITVDPTENLTTLFSRMNTHSKPKKTTRSAQPSHSAETTSTNRNPPKPISNYATNAVGNTNKETPSQEPQSTPSQESQSRAPLRYGNKNNTVHTEQLLDRTCDECGEKLITENNDCYCNSCGILFSDQQIDPGPEWRAFDDTQKDDRTRVGGPVRENIHDKGLSTVIGHDKTDAHGKPISSEMNKKMSRLRKWDRRFKVKNTKERNLRQAFGEIQRMSSEMNLPEYIEETACTVYRRALNEELLPGRSIEAMASASVYIAMRQGGIPKTLDSLLEYCRVEESRVTGAYSYLGKELGIEIKPPEIIEYVSKVASELEVTPKTERMAEKLLQNSIDENIHSGKAPSGMAAAAVYAATMITRQDRITQQQACDAGDVCELTIRTRNRELLEAYGVDYSKTNPPSKKEVKENKNKSE